VGCILLPLTRILHANSNSFRIPGSSTASSTGSTVSLTHCSAIDTHLPWVNTPTDLVCHRLVDRITGSLGSLNSLPCEAARISFCPAYGRCVSWRGRMGKPERSVPPTSLQMHLFINLIFTKCRSACALGRGRTPYGRWARTDGLGEFAAGTGKTKDGPAYTFRPQPNFRRDDLAGFHQHR
jgi:hypothetical protein